MSAPVTAPVGSVRDDPHRFSARQRLALCVLGITILLISLDQSVLNMAIPTLVHDLRPSTSGLEWIVDSYVLTQAVFLLLGGALGDRYGRRRMFMCGSAGFGGGSLMCALVHSTWLLVAARAVTGIGAAFMVPATLALIVAGFDGHRRARAIGIWAGVGGVGSAAGPVLGGLLLQHFWWGSVFLINVPVAVVAIVGAWLVMDESRADDPLPVDPVGVVLSAIGLAALTYALIIVPSKHWGSPEVVGTLIGSAVFLAGFAFWDGRREDPLIDFALFRNPTFSTGLAAVTALFFAMFGTSFLLSQYLQFVERADVFGVGLRFLPMALCSLVASNLSARLTRLFNLRAVLMAGLGCTMAGLGILGVITTRSGYLPVGMSFALLGLGMGLAIAPASTAVVSALPPEKVGAGSGLRSMVQLLGGSFGVAIIGTLAASRYRNEVTQAYQTTLSGVPEPARADISDQIGRAFLTIAELPPRLADRVSAVTDAAFVSGVRLAALIGLAVVAVAAIAVARFIPRNVDVSED
ncbi:MAG TPA: MFS transporter, partial [Mycobacteriales bacterium]|nr:MFS transporter [Mycobacteriales bacterium]